MSLLNVCVNGLNFVVDAPNKSTAKAFGRKQLEVAVTDATADEVTDFITGGGTIEKLEVAAKAVAPVAEAEAAYAE